MNKQITYKPALKLRTYQEEALVAMGGKSAFALFMAMRTGKTLTALTDWGRAELAGLVNDLLVIAPAGVYKTWIEGLQKSLDPQLYKRLQIAVWESSASDKSLAKLDKFLNSVGAPRCFLMNVEALSTVQAARDACEYFLSQRLNTLVIDESTAIKGHKAKRTKYIVEELAPLADYRRILSGLPTPRNPLDLFTQFEFLDSKILGYRNWYSFRARYAVVQRKRFGGPKARPIDVVVGFKNLEELQAKIAPHSYRVEFRPDIPSTYSTWEIKMTTKQQKLYDDMKRFATAQLSATEHVTATIVITQLLRLHQILCGHTVDEAGVAHNIPEHRTDAVLEILDDYAGKAVIWFSYEIDLLKVADALEKQYGEGSVARFWGGNKNTREQEEKEFKTNPACRFTLATPSAGGRGRTWDNADLVIYYSSTNNLEHRDQSEQRVQNVGKDRQVDYIDLLVPGTVDMVFLKALRKKIDMAATITGDNWREWIV